MKKIITSLLILLTTALLVSADEKTDTREKDKAKQKTTMDTNAIIWHRYDKGLKLAKETGRPIFVNFTTTTCGWCKKMNRTTFKEEEVIKTLNNDYITIKVYGDSKKELDIDGYKITERNLARSEYGVRGYPTYWFLKSDVTKIGPLSGYQEANRLKEILFFIENELYDKMKYDEYLEKGGRKGKF